MCPGSRGLSHGGAGAGWGGEEFEEEAAVAREFGKCVECLEHWEEAGGGLERAGGPNGRAGRGLSVRVGECGRQLSLSVFLPPVLRPLITGL